MSYGLILLICKILRDSSQAIRSQFLVRTPRVSHGFSLGRGTCGRLWDTAEYSGQDLSETFLFLNRWLHWRVGKCPTTLTPEAIKQLLFCGKKRAAHYKKDAAKRWCITCPSGNQVLHGTQTFGFFYPGEFIFQMVSATNNESDACSGADPGLWQESWRPKLKNNVFASSWPDKKLLPQLHGPTMHNTQEIKNVGHAAVVQHTRKGHTDSGT